MLEKVIGGLKKFAIVRPSVIATTFSERSIAFLRQQQLNIVLATTYVLQAVLLSIFGTSFYRPVMLHYLAKDPLQSSAQGETVLTSAAHRWFDINLFGLTVVLLLVSAGANFLFATALRIRYERALSAQLQDMRWVSYGITSGIMTVLAGLLIGINDAALLVVLFGLSLIAGFGMLVLEVKRHFWPWSVFAGISSGAAVLILVSYVLNGLLYGAALSWYVYAVVGILVGGMVAVGVNFWLQFMGRKRWSEYLFVEHMYMAISFAVITGVVWMLFFGVLH